MPEGSTEGSASDPVEALYDHVLDVSAAWDDPQLPLRLVSRLLGGREAPVSDLAFMLWSLRDSGVVSDEVLRQLGMSPEGVEAFPGVAVSAGHTSGFSEELEVRSILASLEAELSAAADSLGVSGERVSSLGLLLVEFALSEGLVSIHDAFVRLRAEDPSRIPLPGGSASGDAPH